MARNTSGLRKGRPKGATNKASRDIRELAQQYGPEAMAELARIAREGESEQARVAAIKELLARGYGNPPQAVDLRQSGRIEIVYVNDWRDAGESGDGHAQNSY